MIYNFEENENQLFDYHTFFMGMAYQEALYAFKKGEVPIGAVIVSNNKVIAKGFNQTQQLQDPTAHAEMICLTAACNHLGAKYLENCSIYITLEPCPMCASALKWAQITTIITGANDEKRGYGIYSPSLLHPKTEVIKGIMEEKCTSLLKDFFISKRK